ncbi:L-aspartate oxidase, partial [Streptomyces sp. LP05-1]|nr:L-aspartate oxidase [Streptomyces sp. LP05-1]
AGAEAPAAGVPAPAGAGSAPGGIGSAPAPAGSGPEALGSAGPAPEAPGTAGSVPEASATPEASAVPPALPLLDPAVRPRIQQIMTAGAGVLRSAGSLAEAAARLEEIHAEALAAAGAPAAGPPAAGVPDPATAPAPSGLSASPGPSGSTPSGHKAAEPGVDAWETTNLLCVARVLVAAARRRTETRGCHWREDHPDRDDSGWRRHLVVRLAPDRTLDVMATERQDFPPTDLAAPREP